MTWEHSRRNASTQSGSKKEWRRRSSATPFLPALSQERAVVRECALADWLVLEGHRASCFDRGGEVTRAMRRHRVDRLRIGGDDVPRLVHELELDGVALLRVGQVGDGATDRGGGIGRRE